ncbi:hypothetical protein C8F04DRAFT_1292291, partial [Mycena alexandri]
CVRLCARNLGQPRNSSSWLLSASLVSWGSTCNIASYGARHERSQVDLLCSLPPPRVAPTDFCALPTRPPHALLGGPAVRFLASVLPSLASRWPRAAHASFVSCPESPSLRSGCRERLVRATSPTSQSCFYCTLRAGSVSQRPAAASDTPPSIYACCFALRWHPCMNFCLPSLFGDIL